MTPEEFRKSGHEVVDWIADYLRDVHTLPVVPDVAPGAPNVTSPAATSKRRPLKHIRRTATPTKPAR